MIYRAFFNLIFSRFDPETAHHLGVVLIKFLGATGLADLARLGSKPGHVKVMGLEFNGPFGMAAGFDKNAEMIKELGQLGFSHVEIGTVTRHAQGGNPKPRLFRLKKDLSLINRMGFNNGGADAVAERLAGQPPPGQRRIPLGINLGKSKVAEIEQASADYLASFALLADFADYLVLNVSSPNTPNLRQLQDESRLRELLAAITGANRDRAATAGKRRVPVLLKIAPDLTWPQIDAVLGVIAEYGLDGIIATNTTLARPGTFAQVSEAGGLSGAPLRRRATEIIQYISRTTQGRLPIIGVGGITEATAAAEKLDAGASLVQVYTGMIYRGPFFAADIARAVVDRQRT